MFELLVRASQDDYEKLLLQLSGFDYFAMGLLSGYLHFIHIFIHLKIK